MNFILSTYWSSSQMEVNFIIILNLIGSLFLGILLGYERIYQGRAAGMRTYGLVCMASCALTVFCGYSDFWYGGKGINSLFIDPTRVVQGILTGIGFLGAGVIMKDGFSIYGLSTAASIWMCSAIGILIGIGFYGAGISLAVLSICSMMFISKLEKLLPKKTVINITLKFKSGFKPNEEGLRKSAFDRGYIVPDNGISISMINGCIEWHCLALAIPGQKVATITEMASDLINVEGVMDFNMSPSRH